MISCCAALALVLAGRYSLFLHKLKELNLFADAYVNVCVCHVLVKYS